MRIKVIKIFFLSCFVLKSSSSPSTSDREGRQLFSFRRQEEKSGQRVRPCTTPKGEPGLCQDVTACPALLFDLTILVKSICFQSLFRPGTCCPLIVYGESTTESSSASESEDPADEDTKKQTGFKKVTDPNKKKTGLSTKSPQITTVKSTSTKKTSTTTAATLELQDTTSDPDDSIDIEESPPSLYPNVPDNQPVTNRYGCGVPKVTQARIVNGTESYPGQWPWMAAIYLHGFLGSEFHCGGTVISREYVITAAHCMIDKRGKRFSPSQFSIRLGDNDLSTTNDRADKYAKIFKVESIRIHNDFENFNHQYFKNDIALLKLTKPVEFSPFILPVCLPSKAMEKSHIDSLSGEMATVIGYGRISYSGPQSKKLLKAKMPVWWNKACDDAYFPPILETNVCAGYVEGGIDSCQGDSGGPLLIHRHGKWVLLGIVSFGQKCAEPGYPGVYTRVPKFLEWIQQNARN